MKVKKILILILIASLSICVAACESVEKEMPNFNRIDSNTAKEMMDSGQELIIVDVRTDVEYESGHVVGAINIPVEQITSGDFGSLTDKSKTILIYCRSGNRSRTASRFLAENGYENIYDFGGIIDWKYEIEY